MNNQTAILINHAYDVSPISKFAINQMQAYTHKIIQDQSYLLSQNALLWEQNESHLNQAHFQAKALKRIDQDLYYLSTLNDAVSNYSSKPGEYDLTWSLATNKMSLILNGAKEIILDGNHLNDLLTGQNPFPTGYDNAPSHIVTCSDTSGLFGNSQLTYLSAALLTVHLELLGEQSHLPSSWIDQSAIAHITPIPERIVQNIDASFAQNFSYYHSDNQTEHGLAFIHSGYAFGGQRDENRYGENGKLYGPEDCSSWMAKLVHSDISFSTIDMLYAFRMGQPEAERGYVDESWLNSDGAKIMDYITPVFITDPTQDIQPGLIWVLRKFEDNTDHQYSSGKSGHTALVLGLEDNGDVLTIQYGRNMPETEGFGLQSFASTSAQNTEIMYFSINPQDIFASENDLFSNTNHLENNPGLSESIFYQPLAVLPNIQEEYALL